MNEFIYNNKLNLLKVNANGMIGITEIFNIYDSIKANDNYSKNLLLLIDFKKAIIKLNKADISKVLNNDFLSSYINLKNAIIVDEPHYTAVLMFCYNEIKSDNFNHKVFCAESNALNWLRCISEEEYIMKQMHGIQAG